MLRQALASRRWHAVLSDRGVLALEGVDSRKLLQGLTTTNVDQLDDGKPLYTGFLNAQGRVLGAGYLLPARDGGVVVDIDAAMAGPLAKHLARYKLRSKVKITDQSAEFTVGVCGGPDLEVGPPADGLAGDGAAWCDPRLAYLGWRALLPRDSGGGVLAPSSSTAAPPALHALLQTLLGTSDDVGALPPGSALPLESNLELLAGVTFDKGCYIGQELTARTHSRGVVRKRLMPVVAAAVAARAAECPDAHPPHALAHLPPAECALAAALPLEEWARAWDAAAGAGQGPQGQEGSAGGAVDDTADGGEGGSLSGAGGKSLGKLRRFDPSLGAGVALCRLEALGGGALTTAEGVELVAVRPSWWPRWVGADAQ